MHSKPLVSVVMITYGHEKYIREAIEGVLMQKCDFEIELILANDCSPDGTEAVVQELLKNHPNASWIKYFNHKSNIGMMQNFLFALQQAKGEFIALCDGDDYWTDSLKLQKQVDFLSNDLSYVACFHNVTVVANELSSCYFQERKEGLVPTKEIILNGGGIFPTASILYRNQIKLPEFVMHAKAGDSAIAFSLLEKGSFYFSEEMMAVYRKHQGGVFTSIIQDSHKRFENIISNLNLLVNYRKISIKKHKKYYTEAILKQLNQFSNHFGTSKILKLKKLSAVTNYDIFQFLINKIQFKIK